MRIDGLVCWKCGADLAAVPQPFSRLAECPACRAELHACRLCRFYNPRIEGQCDQDHAEEVRGKMRANFCDYFKPQPGLTLRQDERAKRVGLPFRPAALASIPSAKPRPGAFQTSDAGRTAAAKTRVDDLFGGAPDALPKGGAREGLDALFGGKGDKK